jgi:hypothetical protein
MEAFEEARGKTVTELEVLRLEERHLTAGSGKCNRLSPGDSLSIVHRTLIVVFGGFLLNMRPSTGFFSLTCHTVSQVLSSLLKHHLWIGFAG